MPDWLLYTLGVIFLVILIFTAVISFLDAVNPEGY